MRLRALISAFFFVFATHAEAQWQKINDVDYTFGPFKIYNISLFTETGDYQPDIRPLMLTLKYDKPVDGRDFAISLARSWENLGIKVANQDRIISRLRKNFPNIDPKDSLSYIALEDKGYFVLNDTVLSDEFPAEVNNAIVAVWLDPRVEIGKKITVQKQKDKTETVVMPIASVQTVENLQKSVNNFESELKQAKTAENSAKQAGENSQKSANMAGDNAKPSQPAPNATPQEESKPASPDLPEKDEPQPILDSEVTPALPTS